MQAKQRAIYARMYKKEKPSGDAKCAEAIANYDKANIELKQLDQTYHKKMMKVVPASKVFDAIRAENDFHRNMMKGFQHGRPNGPFNGGFNGGKQWGKRR
jgi:hypothetical protein